MEVGKIYEVVFKDGAKKVDIGKIIAKGSNIYDGEWIEMIDKDGIESDILVKNIIKIKEVKKF